MYSRNHFRNRPRWIDVRYPARCCCGREICPGERGFYFPAGKTVICESCGSAAQKMLVDHDVNRILKLH